MSSTVKSTFLIEACSKGDTLTVQAILAKGTDIHEVDSEGKSALHHCVDINLPTTCASLLLDFSHALLEKTDSAGFNVLQLSCMTGNSDLAQLLIDHGADINAADDQGHTPLHWAVICCQFSCVDVLIRNGAKLSLSDIHGAYPLHYVTQLMTKLETATYAPSILYRLLDNGAPVDCTDHEGQTPLFWAAGFGLLNCCDALLKAGASLSHCDNDGLTLLHCAASKGQTELVTYLIENKKINVDSVDQNGCTPLFYAVTFNHPILVTLLLSHGSNPNHKDKSGFTPVHCAAVKGSSEFMTELRQSGGSMWIKNNAMDTPLHEACESGNLELVQEMIAIAKSEDKLSVLNEPNIHGFTCIHLACEVGAADICEALIKNGAEINSTAPIGDKSIGGFTPLDLASNSACRDLILKQGGESGIMEDCSSASPTSENVDDEGNVLNQFISDNKSKSKSISHPRSYNNYNSSQSNSQKKSSSHLGKKVCSKKEGIILSARQALHNSHKHPISNIVNNSSCSSSNKIIRKSETINASQDLIPPENGTNVDNNSTAEIIVNKLRVDQKDKKRLTETIKFRSSPNSRHSQFAHPPKERQNKSRSMLTHRKGINRTQNNMERHNYLPPLNSGNSPSSDSGNNSLPVPKLSLAETISHSVMEFEGLRISTRDIADKRRKELHYEYTATNNFAKEAMHGSISSPYATLVIDRFPSKLVSNAGSYQLREEDSPWSDRSNISNVNGTTPARCSTDESSVYYHLNEIKRGPTTDDRRRILELNSPRLTDGKKSHKSTKSPRISSAELQRQKRLKKAYAPLIPMDDLIALFQ